MTPNRKPDAMTPTPLSLATLPDLGAVATPTYDRADLSPGILHVGIGNFHRAHQAVYLNDLFQMGQSMDWALIGAGVRAGDEAMRLKLKDQDYLSTVIELAPDGHRASVTGAMIDFVPVTEDNADLIDAMSRPDIRIVSLTVTEGGYYLDPEGAFDASHPDMVADATTPDAPKTVFGAMIKALRNRIAAGVDPFTVMSCDNLPGNGHVAENTLAGLAGLSDPAFAQWIRDNVAFPNGMVDRITPATGPREIDMAATEFGVDDKAPVTCEPFRQWVIEDKFPTGRPALEKVGVTFTDQVEAFELMKIRILNGGHAVIAYPGGLMGIEYVHEAMEHPLIGAFLAKVEQTEVVPIVPPVPDTDLASYLTLIIERFSNPDVADTIRRLCLDGSNRQPKFIIPTILDNLSRGTMPSGLILLSALWCRYCFGTDDAGAEIAPNDPNWDALVERATRARENPVEWLRMDEVYGGLADNALVVAEFTKWLNYIWENGTAAALQTYLDR